MLYDLNQYKVSYIYTMYVIKQASSTNVPIRLRTGLDLNELTSDKGTELCFEDSHDLNGNLYMCIVGSVYHCIVMYCFIHCMYVCK